MEDKDASERYSKLIKDIFLFFIIVGGTVIVLNRGEIFFNKKEEIDDRITSSGYYNEFGLNLPITSSTSIMCIE